MHAENTSTVSVASGIAESSADVTATATHGSTGSQEVAPKKSELVYFLVYV